MPEPATVGPTRIGIDLGGTKIEAAALSPGGVILARHRVPTPRDDYQGTLVAIAGLVERLEQRIGYAASVAWSSKPGHDLLLVPAECHRCR